MKKVTINATLRYHIGLHKARMEQIIGPCGMEYALMLFRVLGPAEEVEMSMGCCESKCAGDITSEQWALVDEIIAKYKGQRGILIPCLHEVQEAVGYLPLEVQERVAAGLDVPLADVYSVVTFYALFSTTPIGKHQVGICMGTACYVRGGDKVLEKVEEVLGIKAGETTDDRLFSIQVMRCIGACGLGPVMTVDDDIYARIKPDRVAEVLAKYS